MSGSAVLSRRAQRGAQTRREILDAAWELVRSEGLGALTMRALGERVGMRAQSLYSYFPSKHAMFDAMFAEANADLLLRLNELEEVAPPDEALRRQAALWLRFCVESPVRYQLLYQRTIPGFEPSATSYRLATEALDVARGLLRGCGIVDPRAVDAWTAVTGGLAAQQNANEPGGDRWVGLLDEVIDMYLTQYRQTAPDDREEG